MQNTPKLSTNTIVALLVFVCAALFSSLFIFHLKNKPPITLAPEQGLLFPAARDIKSFKLVTVDQQAFTEKNLYGHVTLFFFGFTHCSNICPTTLALLNTAYPKMQASHPNLQVVFVSLDPLRDKPLVLKKYLQTFNPQFIGVSGDTAELHKLQSQLGIFAERDTSTPNDNYQLEHTASLLLIDAQGKWAGMLKSDVNPDQLAQAFISSLKVLTKNKNLLS